MLISISLFLLFAGFIIGLGAVTVIDLHGFMGRHSAYWTEATTRTHKITKPLIWIGMFLCIFGGTLWYWSGGLDWKVTIHLLSIPVMILNGVFLSFSVSPFLLQREKAGRSSELLPKKWQTRITFSFIISVISWWGNVILFILSIASKINS